MCLCEETKILAQGFSLASEECARTEYAVLVVDVALQLSLYLIWTIRITSPSSFSSNHPLVEKALETPTS